MADSDRKRESRPTPQKGKLSQLYVIKKKLGKGNFAVVRLIERKSDGAQFAAKIIKKKNLKPDELATLKDEVEILKKLDHPHINKLDEIYDTKHHLYMVLELLTGGELFERIVEKRFYSEAEAAQVTRQIASACMYMHERGVIHRDLKPENLVYLTKKGDSPIKITDFGLAKLTENKGLMKTACGTPGYVAPEILKQQLYDSQVDLWSIGVILYILLCGFPPFAEKNLRGLYRVIKKGQYTFPSPYWDKVSKEAKDCVQKLLVVEPKSRMTAKELLKHKWIDVKTSTASPKNYAGKDSQYINNLRRHIVLSKMKRGINMVLFLNKLQQGTSFAGLLQQSVEVKSKLDDIEYDEKSDKKVDLWK